MNAEDFLKKNCKPEDWDNLTDDGLKDFIWTNNVIKYMYDYSEYRIKNDPEVLELEHNYISECNHSEFIKAKLQEAKEIIEELATIIGAKYDFRDFGVEAQYDRAKKFIERK